MGFLLSVAGLVIAMWMLDRGDWETHRLQIVVGCCSSGVVVVEAEEGEGGDGLCVVDFAGVDGGL
jgi:hypothetical protein